MPLLARLKWLVLISAIFVAPLARAQGYHLISVDCNHSFNTRASLDTIPGIDVDARIADPVKVQTYEALKSMLSAIVRDATNMCEKHGIFNDQSVVAVVLEAKMGLLYEGVRWRKDMSWKAIGDYRNQVIPKIIAHRRQIKKFSDEIAEAAPSATTQDQFCSNFTKYRARLAKLSAVLNGEQNPLRAQQDRQNYNKAYDSGYNHLASLYGTGFKKFASYTGVADSLSQQDSDVVMDVTMDCQGIQLIFDVEFTNGKIPDPPRPGDYKMSSLKKFRATLMKLNNGDHVQMSGLFQMIRLDAPGGGDGSYEGLQMTNSPLYIRVQLSKLEIIGKAH